jgi:hypothetical protein
MIAKHKKRRNIKLSLHISIDLDFNISRMNTSFLEESNLNSIRKKNSPKIRT